MAENKIKTKALIPYVFSFISFLASYLIYILIPSSDFANSIEHPGITAVYVLTISPVFCFFAVALTVATYIISKKYYDELLGKNIALAGVALISVIQVISLIFSVMFVVSQYRLGFTAPIHDTKWASYSIFILVSCLIQSLSAVLLILKSKGIIKK